MSIRKSLVNELIDRRGSEKLSTSVRRRVAAKHGGLRDIPQINDDIKKVCRLAGRHPSEPVLHQLHVIHDKMKEQFLSMPDEAIEWMLGGSSEMSRGGFQNDSAKGITAAQKFKVFLAADPETISPQKLASSIETIGTAMGYRAIHASWVAPPHTPETPAQQLMDDKIQKIMKSRLAAPIGDVYTARAKDGIDPIAAAAIPAEKMIHAEQEDVSSASAGVEEVDKLPQKSMESRYFRKHVTGEHLSWIGAAVAGNVPVRGHTSGTCPLTMAAVDGLCATGDSPDTWLADDKHFKELAGVLVISTFQRGDYHTIAETACGVHHYLNDRAIKNGEEIDNSPLQPYDAFCEGLSMLKSACTTDKLQEDDALGLQKAVAYKCNEIRQLVTKVKGNTKEFNPSNPSDFYTSEVIRREKPARASYASVIASPSEASIDRKAKLQAIKKGGEEVPKEDCRDSGDIDSSQVKSP